MSANFPAVGEPRQLDRRAEPDEQITEQQAKDSGRVARLLMTLLRDVVTLKRRWWPRRYDFEDRLVDDTGTTKYRFHHGFNGRVRWWVVDWSNASTNSQLIRHADSDNNTLVLVSNEIGKVTIRIEEAG